MLEGSKALDLCLSTSLAFFIKIWSKCTFGQAAYSARHYQFGKFLTCGFLVVGISSSPMVTVLRDQLLFHDHRGSLMLLYSEVCVGFPMHLYSDCQHIWFN